MAAESEKAANLNHRAKRVVVTADDEVIDLADILIVVVDDGLAGELARAPAFPDCLYVDRDKLDALCEHQGAYRDQRRRGEQWDGQGPAGRVGMAAVRLLRAAGSGTACAT